MNENRKASRGKAEDMERCCQLFHVSNVVNDVVNDVVNNVVNSATWPESTEQKTNKKAPISVENQGFLLEVTGFEPTAFWSRTKRATKLRYTSWSR